MCVSFFLTHCRELKKSLCHAQPIVSGPVVTQNCFSISSRSSAHSPSQRSEASQHQRYSADQSVQRMFSRSPLHPQQMKSSTRVRTACHVSLFNEMSHTEDISYFEKLKIYFYTCLVLASRNKWWVLFCLSHVRKESDIRFSVSLSLVLTEAQVSLSEQNGKIKISWCRVLPWSIIH